MNKLELKHIAPYLPYGLKCHAMGEYVDNDHPDGSEPKLLTVSGTYTDTLGDRYIEAMHDGDKYEISFNADFFPILRPLSDLRKEIGGKIGIAELAEIAAMSFGIDFEFEDVGISGCWAYAKSGERFGFSGYEFYLLDDEQGSIEINQLELFQYLFEHHYDVFELIEKDLAVDINKI